MRFLYFTGGRRLQNRGQRGRKQRTEQSKIKSSAIRTVCVNFVSYRLFGGGRGRFYPNSRSRRPPPSPHPKEFIKIGLRPIAWTAIFAHYRIEDWGDIRFIYGGRKSKSRAVPLGLLLLLILLLLCSALCFLFSALCFLHSALCFLFSAFCPLLSMLVLRRFLHIIALRIVA